MSNAYITEPPTKGKILLHTTLGPLEVELWPKETPKACRNFVQLCLEGYYDNTIFHRIVKDFIVQGGDPTGTGHGGESVFGAPFADEFHSRLRFSHRGLLAMANTGENDNRSQFFFTLDRADELNRKSTIFGKIVGDTIYNLLKFSALETDEEERPLYPPKFLRAEVLSNPFDDIKLRTTPEERLAQAAALRAAKEKEEQAKKPKGKKNLSLLSFGEEEAETAKSTGSRIKSSHDVLTNDPRLRSDIAVELSTRSRTPVPSDHSLRSPSQTATEEEKFERHMRESVVTKRPRNVSPTRRTESSIRQMKSEVEKVQSEIRAMNTGRLEVSEDGIANRRAKEKLVDRMRAEFVDSGKAISAKRRRVKGETDTLEMLRKFQGKIRDTSSKVSHAPARASDADASGESQECQLHFVRNCASCRDTFGKKEEGDEEGWMATKLVFEKERGANVYEPRVEDYTVIDPRAHSTLDDKQRGRSLKGREGHRTSGPRR
ncbi:uncharacterized protein SPPG_08609 [Spizellomyces punctatus DAOM BR117]|uniref:Peptidyl-prolyl isomerase CWC27 n=1 Tax=Spizellomyces punctatus (strain DAOM BR117) TaxID=645134 RepID=A0A0L0H485_SPIPD|nr:uncharacterized protein SPPG_08609 [Spizellomyces punctatus DAOM BR117]KNC96012.1 hypothetical protein SPPG_08609 [Spizellomyces punctatus DAOM BR117]|eukprot:XP_016604052.1 hypothetical protein SPPG_08609 [Spizellomyces punctatus DAOM BR117]